MQSQLRPVPPSPEVLTMLYMDFLRLGEPEGLTFKRYLRIIGYVDPARDAPGMDDGATVRMGVLGPELISVPTRPIVGELQVKVLLVDFEDWPGVLNPIHYREMFFSEAVYPTGSLRDYYTEVTCGQVSVTGEVHGWFRMPKPYRYYTNGESGTNWDSYPRNAPRLAEDAVKAALAAGIDFPNTLDKLSQGIITALVIIHAGRGAEVMPPPLQKNEIWSHKWALRNPVPISPQLQAGLYLVVPNDCKVGVCAHELGHLAFQWEDFYDPNYDEDGSEWDGSGRWDLMAGGSYNGEGSRPAHPAGLHKSQHGWIDVEDIRTSTSITLTPYSSTTGKVFRILSPTYKPKQYLLLENRAAQGFDFDLPGEGLLVWRVDESHQQVSADQPALLLMQADGRHDLENPIGWNQGDAGDPFPGSTGRHSLPDSGDISTTFPNQKPSGVSLRNIARNPTTGDITLDVVFDP